MKTFFKNNSLSIVFFLLFLLTMCGQSITGYKQHNDELKEKGGKEISFSHYFTTGHFIESTFENWESEFLQMGFFVVLTIFLYQKGSSESKDPEGGNKELDKEPDPNKPGSPLAVKKGGFILKMYKNSLSLALFCLFLISFVLHWYGSLKDYNEEQTLQHLPTQTGLQYLSNSKFWFESFQNWQSEFLSIFAIGLLSIYLRQHRSPQSKPVDAAHSETGK